MGRREEWEVKRWNEEKSEKNRARGWDGERSGRSKGVSSNGGKQARTAWSRLNWSSAKVVAVVRGDGWGGGGEGIAEVGDF